MKKVLAVVLVAVALVTWSFWDRFDHDPRFGGSAAFPMADSLALASFRTSALASPSLMISSRACASRRPRGSR